MLLKNYLFFNNLKFYLILEYLEEVKCERWRIIGLDDIFV